MSALVRSRSLPAVPGDVRRLLWLAAVAVAAAFIYPAITSGTSVDSNLDRVALALALAGPAAGTAVAAAAGRPLLAAAAMSGVGAYVSGYLGIHGLAVPVAILAGTAAGGAAGAVCGLLGGRLDAVAFLVLTLVLAIAAGAIGSMPIVPAAARWRDRALEQTPRSTVAWGFAAASTASLVVLLVASIMQMAARTYNPFIYFRF